jgi:hypothetical protein
MVMFMPNGGSIVHVANLTRSTIQSTAALCGKAFTDVTKVKGGMQATCANCRRYDNPFKTSIVPYDPLIWNIGLNTTTRTGILKRDLITDDGQITPRGAILARDLTNPTPWVDSIGIVHARRPGGGRGHGACGADLLGCEEMTYDRLAKMHDLYGDIDVTCMACVAIGTAQP